MKFTENLLLKLPEPTEFVLVEDLNENFTKIDTEIAKITDEETGVEAKLTQHLDDNVRHVDYATASGTNAYTATIPNVKTLIEGMSVKVKFTNANTAGSTLNINGLGAKEIRKGNGNTLLSGNIKAGQILHLVYTGSNFQVLGEGGSGNLKPNQALAGYTFSNDDGDQVGVGDTNLKPENIRKDTTIFGVMGTLGVGQGGLTQNISLTWEQEAKTLFLSSSGTTIQTVYPLSNSDTIVVTNGGFGRITKQGALVYFVDFYALFGRQETKLSAIDMTGNYLVFYTEFTGDATKAVRTYNVNGTPLSVINAASLGMTSIYSVAVDNKGKAVYSYRTAGYSSNLDYEGLYSFKSAPADSGRHLVVDSNRIVYAIAKGTKSGGIARITTAMAVTYVGDTSTVMDKSPLLLDNQHLYSCVSNGNTMNIEKISITTGQVVDTMYLPRFSNTVVPYYGDCRHRNNLLLFKVRVYSDNGAFTHYMLRTDFGGITFMNTRKPNLTTKGDIQLAFHIQGDEFYVLSSSGSSMVIGHATIKNEIVL